MTGRCHRLSVIVPGYKNPDGWWSRCVSSILSAIGADDEIICVDDGSPVRPRVLEEWAAADRRVHVLHKSNGGLADARNEALEIAQGDFIAFVDSDDEIGPETFERCLEMMARSESDICFYGVEVQWVNEGLKKSDISDNHVYGRLSPRDVLDLSRRCLLNYACNKVYRLSFLEQHQIRFENNGMPCEDIIFNLDCICAGAAWCSIDYVGYVYYRVSGGRTILSSYKPTNYKGLALGAAAWKRYCETLPAEEAKRFADRCVLTERQLQEMEWKNIWMPGSPYSLLGRWKWLGESSEFRVQSLGFRVLGRVKVFVKMLVFTFLRRHFYFRPIRRRHIKRLFPNVEEMR